MTNQPSGSYISEEQYALSTDIFIVKIYSNRVVWKMRDGKNGFIPLNEGVILEPEITENQRLMHKRNYAIHTFRDKKDDSGDITDKILYVLHGANITSISCLQLKKQWGKSVRKEPTNLFVDEENEEIRVATIEDIVRFSFLGQELK